MSRRLHIPGRVQRSIVVKTLRPPQPGTLKPLMQHGSALVCVRYRRDPNGMRRYTTVELVVSESPVVSRAADTRWYELKLDRLDEEHREALIDLGARWMPTRRLWLAKGWMIRRLNLQPYVLRPTRLAAADEFGPSG